MTEGHARCGSRHAQPDRRYEQPLDSGERLQTKQVAQEWDRHEQDLQRWGQRSRANQGAIGEHAQMPQGQAFGAYREAAGDLGECNRRREDGLQASSPAFHSK